MAFLPDRNSITWKVIIIGVLSLLLLIPTLMINDLVREREMRRESAISEVSGKWAGEQTICGPFVSVPYTEVFRQDNGQTVKQRKYFYLLPHELQIGAQLEPRERSRGIYEVVVYDSEVRLEATFEPVAADARKDWPDNLQWEDASLLIGLTDLRGIRAQPSLANGQAFQPGVPHTDVVSSGIQVPVNLAEFDSAGVPYSLSLDLELKGSQQIRFVPLGQTTVTTLNGAWPNPKYDGAFLPDTHTVDQGKFNAWWEVLHLNRNYPQWWSGAAHGVYESAFGMDLFIPADQYSKTDRAIKYALLFIVFTFIAFFFIEIINKKNVHPVQYLLVGLAIVLFFILLLSISEHLHFDLAYLLAAAMTVGLVTWYARTVLGNTRLALWVGGVLAILYGFIFVLLQLADFALLSGSIGLFVALAIIMHLSRKINWGIAPD